MGPKNPLNHARPIEVLASLTATRPAPRVMLVRSGGLGDTILLLPALQILRRQLPGVRLTLVGSEWAEALRPLIPFPLTLVRFDAPILAPLFGSMLETDPSGLFAGADAVILYSADSSSPFAQNATRHCAGPVRTWPITPAQGTHAAVHFAQAIAQGAINPDDLPAPRLRPPSGLLPWARGWLDARLGPLSRPVAIHPGSGGRRKCWPARRFATLAARLDRPVLLLEGPADAEPCREFAAQLPLSLRTAHAAGLPIPQAAALLCECRLYVGSDSGVSHLAAALGVPTMAVFGPTDPAVWQPLGDRVALARAMSGAAWPAPDEVALVARRLCA
jgi:heptosyltransferase-2